VTSDREVSTGIAVEILGWEYAESSEAAVSDSAPPLLRTMGPDLKAGRPNMGMKVWIDQDLCTGDGLCEEIAPAVFTLLDDGLAYVKEGDKVFNDPGGAEGLANIPDGELEAVIESAEECPGECIFIEVE
jgi:ferredoxin